ncbi:GAP family protein [Mycolicibacterium thermoresistibile]
MWGTVLLLALVATVDPLRVGFAMLFISRPRPMLHLFSYWLGGMVMTLAFGLGALFVLRDLVSATPATEGGAFGQVRIVLGVVGLLIAMTIAVRLVRRQRAAVPQLVDGPPAMLLESVVPAALARLSSRAQGLLDRWSVWAAFIVGIGMATPVEYLAALAVILASGAAAGTQVSALAIYAVVGLLFAEIPLLSHLAAPAATHDMMVRMHGWLWARRQAVVAGLAAVVGAFLLATGMGVL